MWHNPRLMTATADLLWVVGAGLLLVAGGLWIARQPIMPLTRVVVTNELREVQRGDVEQALQGLRGNMLGVSLDNTRSALEKLAWVRRAEVRRRWPGTLELTLHEQVPVARWGEGTHQLVNEHGEVFYAGSAQQSLHELPVFQGPLGAAPDILARFRESRELLTAAGRKPVQVTLTARLAWQLRLDDGLVIELGRDQPKTPVVGRLKRFVEVYEQVAVKRSPRPTQVDLRYPNGFVMRVVGTAGSGGEGRGNT
jgi:cell division protein FtsQ